MQIEEKKTKKQGLELGLALFWFTFSGQEIVG